jgi:uncharacterized protein YuzE
MTFSYDDDADVLYMTFAEKPSKRVYIENDNNDILWVDESSGEVLGCTIMQFTRRLKSGKPIEIPEIGAVQFNDLMQLLLHQIIEANSA